MATLRLIVDLTTAQGTSFDAEVARIKANVDNGASGQTFKTLGVGVITYTVPDVAKFPLAYSTVGNLGELIPAKKLDAMDPCDLHFFPRDVFRFLFVKHSNAEPGLEFGHAQLAVSPVFQLLLVAGFKDAGERLLLVAA